MPSDDAVILVGVKSPIVVEYEETLARLGMTLTAAISLGGPARLLARDKRVERDACGDRFQGQPFVACAFAPQNRRVLHAAGIELGLVPAPPLLDPTAILARSTRLSAGSYVNAGAVLGAASIFGASVLINRAANIGHHCLCADFVSIGPGATLAGNVRLAEAAVIGAGAIILPDVKIGAGAVVAAGAVVREDVAPGVLVAGHPAKPRRSAPEATRVWANDQE